MVKLQTSSASLTLVVSFASSFESFSRSAANSDTSKLSLWYLEKGGLGACHVTTHIRSELTRDVMITKNLASDTWKRGNFINGERNLWSIGSDD